MKPKVDDVARGSKEVSLVVQVRPLGQSMQEAVREELRVHSLMMSLIVDPAFWEAHRRGLNQIEAGDTITIEELETR